jgi:hypothetical protein
MFEHTIVYTFDRLKIAFALGFLLMVAGSRIVKQYSARGFCFVFLFVAIGTYLSFREFTELYRPYWR